MRRSLEVQAQRIVFLAEPGNHTDGVQSRRRRSPHTINVHTRTLSEANTGGVRSGSSTNEETRHLTTVKKNKTHQQHHYTVADSQYRDGDFSGGRESWGLTSLPMTPIPVHHTGRGHRFCDQRKFTGLPFVCFSTSRPPASSHEHPMLALALTQRESRSRRPLLCSE
jgi:hypothetical protein